MSCANCGAAVTSVDHCGYCGKYACDNCSCACGAVQAISPPRASPKPTSFIPPPRPSEPFDWRPWAQVLGALTLALALLFFLHGCASTSVRGARIEAAHSALNMLTDAVDPAYEAARVGCKAADDAAITLTRADLLTIEQLDSRVRESRAKCDKTFGVFEKVRELQAAARAALDRAAGDEGALSQAEAAIRDIRALWRKPHGN